ncbi:hypothetical protein V2W45_1241595 [Cenococcum geophilum]
MLESIEEFHSDAYGSFLHRSRDSGLDFLSLLRPEALRVLSSGNYSRDNLLLIGGNTPKVGIYLHIIWLKSDSSIYFLYVGQSIEMPTRLDHHRDPEYRARNPSLHYFVWDRGDENKMYEVEEEFVFLSAIDRVDPLLLNLLEMWCCLMLQTLTKNALAKYLPANMVAPYAGTHLNIAIPLHQAPYCVMVDTQDPSMYHTSDPMVAQYYTSLRRRFYELKFSPNMVLRDYYAKVMRQRVITRVQTNQKKLVKGLEGVEKLVKIRLNKSGSAHQEFFLASFSFTISRKWVHLEHNAPVQVRFESITEDEFRRKGNHPNVYCLNATKDDPASRLAVFVEGTSDSGAPFAGWLRSNAEKKVFKINTLVDMFEGGSMIKSRHLPRRWIELKFQNQHGEIVQQAFYTKNSSQKTD